MSVQEFRETCFTEHSRPALATIKSWIKSGELAGKRIGRLYFVVTDDAIIAHESKPTTEPDFSSYESKQKKK